MSPASIGGSPGDIDPPLPLQPVRTISTDSLEKSMTVTITPVSTASTLVAFKIKDPEPQRYAETNPWKRFGTIRHLDEAMANLLHPDEDLSLYRPRVPSIIKVIWIFIGFAILLAVAAKVPVGAMRWIVVGFGCISFLCAVFILRRECWSHRDRLYKTNLGNTALTILIVVPLFTVLYAFLWYGNLRSEVLVTTTDSVSSVSYPSLSLFQRNDWAAQAELTGTGSKCFLGWYNDSAPACSTLSAKDYASGANCNCHELWDDKVTEDFIWHGVSYRYISFEAANWLLDDIETHLMLLQAFFNFNGTKELATNTEPESPSLMVALYDPELGLQTSLDAGYTRMTFISANGIVSINVDLRTRQVSSYPPAYDYDLSFSSSPATGVVCNDGDPGSYSCFLTLMIQIPSFERENIRTQNVMGWLDVAASAGAYFSFVQFISWIISAQAFDI